MAGAGAKCCHTLAGVMFGEAASVKAATWTVLKRTCYHTITVDAGTLLHEHIHTACNQAALLLLTILWKCDCKPAWGHTR